jgi:hypothetical protein
LGPRRSVQANKLGRYDPVILSPWPRGPVLSNVHRSLLTQLVEHPSGCCAPQAVYAECSIRMIAVPDGELHQLVRRRVGLVGPLPAVL